MATPGYTGWGRRSGSSSALYTNFQLVLLFCSLPLTLAFGGSCCGQLLRLSEHPSPLGRCENTSLSCPVRTEPLGIAPTRYRPVLMRKDKVGSLLSIWAIAVRRIQMWECSGAPTGFTLYSQDRGCGRALGHYVLPTMSFLPSSKPRWPSHLPWSLPNCSSSHFYPSFWSKSPGCWSLWLPGHLLTCVYCVDLFIFLGVLLLLPYMDGGCFGDGGAELQLFLTPPFCACVFQYTHTHTQSHTHKNPLITFNPQ